MSKISVHKSFLQFWSRQNSTIARMFETTEIVSSAPDDLEFSHMHIDESDIFFAQVIGCIEDIIMDKKFLDLHTEFMDKYYMEFDNSEENKFIYTDIFQKYNSTIEKYIEGELVKSIEGFEMNRFENELKKRGNELDGEIFEILATFTDFLSFKTMFLDYKAMKEGKCVDFSKDIFVSKCSKTEL